MCLKIPRKSRHGQARQNNPTTTQIDHASVLAGTKMHSKKLKHIDLRYHFIVDEVEQKPFKLTKVAGEENVADIFTKAYPANVHNAGESPHLPASWTTKAETR